MFINRSYKYINTKDFRVSSVLFFLCLLCLVINSCSKYSGLTLSKTDLQKLPVIYDFVNEFSYAEKKITTEKIDMSLSKSSNFIINGFSTNFKLGRKMVNKKSEFAFYSFISNSENISQKPPIYCEVYAFLSGKKPISFSLTVNNYKLTTVTPKTRKMVKLVWKIPSNLIINGLNKGYFSILSKLSKKNAVWIKKIKFKYDKLYKAQSVTDKHYFYLKPMESVAFYVKETSNTFFSIEANPVNIRTNKEALLSIKIYKENNGLVKEISIKHSCWLFKDIVIKMPADNLSIKKIEILNKENIIWKIEKCVLVRKKTLSLSKNNPSFKKTKDKIHAISPIVSNGNEHDSKFIASQKHQNKTFKKSKPNILIYLLDSLREDNLGCFGYPLSTSPYIDRFSKHFMTFVNVHATSSWTRPSVASLLTGLSPESHTIKGSGEKHSGRLLSKMSKLPRRVKILPEFLTLFNYYSICLLANSQVGEEFGFKKGYEYFEDSSVFYNRTPILISTFNRIKFPKNRPFFAYLHTMDTHVPYRSHNNVFKRYFYPNSNTKFYLPKELPLKKLLLKTNGKNFTLRSEQLHYTRKTFLNGNLSLTPNLLKTIKALYDNELYFNDAQFGKLIKFLIYSKKYDDSVIIFTSDHGDEFYEHGSILHGHTTFEELIHIPLIIKFPFENFQTHILSNKISMEDITPSLLELLDIPSKVNFDGISFLRNLQKPHLSKNRFFISFANTKWNKQVSIIHGDFKLICNLGKKMNNSLNLLHDKLFNIANDPAEKNNLIWRKKFIAQYLFFSLVRILQNKKAVAAKEEYVEKNSLKKKTYKQLKELGYINN